MSSFSLWTLIKPQREGFLVTVSAIPLGEEDSNHGEYLTDYSATLAEAKEAGLRLADHLGNMLARRGHYIVSADITVEERETND